MARLIPPLLVALLLPSAARAALPGDVIVSELLIKAGSGGAEWIELYNTSTEAQPLDGCMLMEGTDQALLDGLTVPASEYVLLSRSQSCVVYDEGGDCQRPSDFVYSGITLNDSSTETLQLLCDGVEIDAVTYNWADDLGDDCPSGSICAANLRPEAMDAASNDDWPGSWCVPGLSTFVYDALGREMLSTPGALGQCPVAGPPCGVGDIVFTELMIAPTTSSREWFELKVRTASGCDLQGCVLQEGPFADPFEQISSEDWARHTIDAPGNVLALSQGDYAVFAKGQDAVGTGGRPPGLSVADYRYSGISFANSPSSNEEGWIHLICDGVAVDSARYDWDAFEGSCPDRSCSVNLPPAAEDSESNDLLSSWCVPSDDDVWVDLDGREFLGTPGFPGACDDRDWASAGSALFSELMVSPQVSPDVETPEPEWVELADLGTGAGGDLRGCLLLETDEALDPMELPLTHTRDALANLDSNDPWSSWWLLGSEGSLPRISRGGALALGDGGCIDGSLPQGGQCPLGEGVYDGISFTDSRPGNIALLCPVTGGDSGAFVLVDQAAWDLTRTGFRKGHSAQFDPRDGELANDDPDGWCEASFLRCFQSTEDGQCNFGSPGESHPCETALVPSLPAGPGCHCGAGTSREGLSFSMLLLCGLVIRRRRTRRE